ncbi:hypothetical protein ACQR1W_31350 [Bradyrhizobium sp. HKCCYLS1011]|uniref:hypothetical protein n=1 Tax=Bradyrhizobium sp. HKCCYLS1011 TaxID=3420733 RepID=UPI003EBB8C3F
MSFIETIIIALAILFGLNYVGDAIDNVAVGIEMAGRKVAEAIEDALLESDEDEDL